MNWSDIFYIGLLLNGLLCNAVRIFGEFSIYENWIKAQKYDKHKNKAQKAL